MYRLDNFYYIQLLYQLCVWESDLQECVTPNPCTPLEAEIVADADLLCAYTRKWFFFFFF